MGGEQREREREINHSSERTRIIGACDDNGIRKEFVITPEPPFRSLSFPPLSFSSPQLRQILTPPCPSDNHTLDPFPRISRHSKSVMRARPTFVGNGRRVFEVREYIYIYTYTREKRKMNPQVFNITSNGKKWSVLREDSCKIRIWKEI